MSPSLSAELAREVATTRRHLERIPADRFDWRPHPKSATAGALASHLVSCLAFVEPIAARDALDFDTSARPAEAREPGELLARFDVAAARAVDALRDMALSHLVHHRGQLSVYLRLLGVPVPATYGPTADDAG